MASRPALDALPTEIVASIASHVRTVDRRNLRLVGPCLAHQLYPEMPTAKRLNAASESDLRMFIAMTDVGQPGCLLESLTLVEKLGEHDVAVRTAWSLEEETAQEIEEESGINSAWCTGPVTDRTTTIGDVAYQSFLATAGYMGRTEEQQSSLDIPESVDLLVQAFRNIRTYSNSRSLPKLVLKTVDCRKQLKNGMRWEFKPFHITRTTGDLQGRVFSALDVSRLSVAALEITGLNQPRANPPRNKIEENRFVFGCDGLASTIGAINLEQSFRGLKELSIEFSPSSHAIEYPGPQLDSEGEEVGPGPTTRRDYKPLVSICHLLKFCPGLETLRLKGYDAFGAGEVSLLQHIVDSCPLPLLKTCTLDGFGTRNGELLAFLRHHSALGSFSMIALYETNEQYVEIFNHIATKMPQLKFFHLDNMWERKLHTDGTDEEWMADKRHIVNLCWFQSEGGGGVQHYPHSRMSGVMQITREGEVIHAVIEKKEFRGGRGRGSGGLMIWNKRWRASYGPSPSWS